VLTRREGALALAVSLLAAAPADAIGFKKELKKRKIPIEEYSQLGKQITKKY
jgi:predicted HTH domain antitoxin